MSTLRMPIFFNLPLVYNLVGWFFFVVVFKFIFKVLKEKKRKSCFPIFMEKKIIPPIHKSQWSLAVKSFGKGKP